jgi:hypothetical protein
MERGGEEVMASVERAARFVVVAAATAVTLCFVPIADAQTEYAALVGLVRDSAGHPIPGVEVRLRRTELGSTRKLELAFARTNDSGGFRLPNLDAGPGSVAVRRMGFSPATVDVKLRAGRTDSLVVSLTAIAVSLPGVLVEDEYMARSKRLLAGFWERRSRGFGSFITRDEIEQRDPHEFADLARMIPSVSVQNRGGRKVIRFTRGSTARDCPPQYYVDGMRIENGQPDEFTPQDVEAVELYAGPATMPPQFTPRPFTYTCGAIVIWTRLPGP